MDDEEFKNALINRNKDLIFDIMMKESERIKNDSFDCSINYNPNYSDYDSVSEPEE